ncbi:MAG: hypothetical protein QMD85_03840 [Candidatus Aenigmarchaeota archaeon]|nr:hypothetical protein [Candidatus Aenigmarchaeota archaeon]MDI6722688.1 hypothetical protein [Candidatus Aenigmarchaeota archaeon]
MNYRFSSYEEGVAFLENIGFDAKYPLNRSVKRVEPSDPPKGYPHYCGCPLPIACLNGDGRLRFVNDSVPAIKEYQDKIKEAILCKKD